ncbi:hypothetical protein ACLMAJ_16450 [Nocardia sp. KC 131]|uniref:hypothetical protein n=1 Tax=Nocardia arseniciresistens TaxID=3392119 RepID=UPI00398E36B4
MSYRCDTATQSATLISLDTSRPSTGDDSAAETRNRGYRPKETMIAYDAGALCNVIDVAVQTITA